MLFPLISPDGATVVYILHDDATGTSELYSVPIEGGPSVKLTEREDSLYIRQRPSTDGG
jgi:hypothetical protein